MLQVSIPPAYRKETSTSTIPFSLLMLLSSSSRSIGHSHFRLSVTLLDIKLEHPFLFNGIASYFKQYAAFSDCLFLLKRVRDWRPFEPQSHRDLALACELNGDIKDGRHRVC